jgi:hypothetical protein
MPDMQKLQNNKERIISIIKTSGPSFPARIASQTGISPLFVSAMLAELVSDKRLKISDMKIGSSPLYFIQGQEHELENFTKHLNQKQREAHDLLKESKVLSDEQQPPAIRVALRTIKDFAQPINVRVDDKIKLFWKHSSLQDTQQTYSLIQQILSGNTIQKPKQIRTVQQKIASSPQIKQQTPNPSAIPRTQPTSRDLVITTPSTTKPTGQDPPITKNKKTIPSQFTISIREHLESKDIEILEEISSKKREFISRIRTDEKFGKQEFYAIAKDKKKITTNDLTIAFQNAQNEKMPALLISTGQLDKKAQEHLKTWKNLIKFEKVNL